MNSEPQTVAEQECTRCGHKWLPRTLEKPTVCPSCKTPYWDRPRKTEEPPKAEATAVGNISVFGTPDQQALLKARQKFVEDYCKQRGLTPGQLTLPQILEMRKLDGWKHPEVTA